MSLWRQRGITGPPAQDWIPRRAAGGGVRTVTGDAAMRNSAVWACLRLRANLISMMPVDVYRNVEGRQVAMVTPPVLESPDGVLDIGEWMFSSQMDLDRFGNDVGLVTARDAAGRPARIELQLMAETTFIIKDGRIDKVRIRGKKYDYSEVWHERQYTIGGLPFGLSPLAYAAWTLGEYASIQEFAQEWFDNGTRPGATMKNTARMIEPKIADAVKDRYKASVSNGDLFVYGSDWEFSPMTMEASATNWIDGKRYDDVAISRFLDVPADVIDANLAKGGGDIVYANVTQKNLQLLIMNLQPAITRRERAFSRFLVAGPRFVKLATDSLLRMDPVTRISVLAQQISSRQIAPSEARELDNRALFTDAQLAEFDRLFGPPKGPTPTAGAIPSGGTS